jgi:hypothetical protein
MCAVRRWRTYRLARRGSTTFYGHFKKCFAEAGCKRRPRWNYNLRAAFTLPRSDSLWSPQAPALPVAHALFFLPMPPACFLLMVRLWNGLARQPVGKQHLQHSGLTHEASYSMSYLYCTKVDAGL